MELLLNFLDWFGRISTAIVIIAVIWGVILWIRGVVPLSFRAGRIRQNKIAIFASNDNYNELLQSLDSTKIFNKSNFTPVNTEGSMDAALNSNIFVVNWEDWGNNIDQILDKKTHDTGMVVYALPGKIDQPNMEKLQKYNFVTVTNFRGRLITDLLTMALAIRYARKK